MPRYYFRLRDGGIVPDHDGEELADDAQARHAAVEVFAETVVGKTEHLCDEGDYEVLVLSEDELPVFSITAQGKRL